MSMPLFAVIRTFGGAWQPSARLEDQTDWAAHAAFMRGLEKEGVIALGGPLDGTADVLLIFRANSPEDITARLQDDPWTRHNLLRVSRIAPWTIRLGKLA